MFKINFYHNNAEPNRVDKLPYLKFYTTMSGDLKNSTSIVNPTIFIEFKQREDLIVDDDNILVMDNDGNLISTIELEELLSCNYCHIPSFNRYYYINDITSVRNNLWEISMTCDTLMSYKEDILNLNCYVGRNEFEFNKWLTDTELPSDNKFNIDIIGWSLPYSKYVDKEYVWDFSDLAYFVSAISPFNQTVVVENNAKYLPTICKFNTVFIFETENSLNLLMDDMLQPNFWTSLGNAFANPSDYINGIIGLPFKFSQAHEVLKTEDGISPFLLSYVDRVYIGNGVEINGVAANILTNYGKIRFMYKIDETTPLIFDDFTDYTPYSTYYIYLPFYGITEIHSRILASCKYIVYDVEPNGDFQLGFTYEEPAYYNDYSSMLTLNGNMGVTIPLGGSNETARQQKFFNTALSFFSGGVNSLINFGSGMKQADMLSQSGAQFTEQAIMKGFTSKVGLGTSLLNNASNALTEIINNTPTAYMKNMAGSSLSYKNILRPYIFKFTPNFYEPLEYTHLVGKPLLQTKILNELHGFTIVNDLHIENIKNATINELGDIKSRLMGGVILP